MSLIKQVSYCSVGTVFEWYEFTVFIYLTPIIAQLFFPKSDGATAIIGSLAIFATGYLMRPLGAILFGHLGDRYGRKYTLVITIFLMAIATTGIGLIPTGYPVSMLLLVVCRMVQGLACSGEYPSSVALLSELNSYRHRALIACSGLFSTALGSFTGALVYALIYYSIDQTAMQSWGWRLPFLLGAPIGIFGYYLRRKVAESQVFNDLKEKYALPFWQLLKHHSRILLAILAIYSFNNILIYMDTAYFGNYALSLHKISSNHLTILNLTVSFTYAIAILFFGFLSDYVDKNKLLISGTVLTTIFIYPLFSMALTGDLSQQITAQILIALLLGTLLGPLTIMAALSFPSEVRCSGLSLAVNIGGALFGGTAPLVCAWLTKLTAAPLAPAYYALGFGVLAILGSVLGLRTHTRWQECLKHANH